MNLTLLLVLIIIFAFWAGHVLTRYASRFVALSGVEYALVGVLIGPHVGLGLLTEASLEQLTPLIDLLLGLVGALVGLRCKKVVATLELGLSAFLAAISVALVCAAVFLVALSRFAPSDWSGDGQELVFEVFSIGDSVVEFAAAPDLVWAALGVAAAACVSSTVLIEQAASRWSASGSVTSFLRVHAVLGQIVGVLILGFVLAAARATSTANQLSLSVTEWGVSAVGLGVLAGALFGLFIGHESDKNRLFLASIGLVTFAAGIGSALKVSPLFVNLLAGVTVAFTSSHASAIAAELERLEHPLFVLLMIFAGTLWQPVQGALWLLPLLYAGTRYVAKRMATAATNRLVLREPLPSIRLGKAVIAQGAIAVAVGLNLAQRSELQSAAILTMVLGGTLVSDLFANRWLYQVLADAGELTSDAGTDATAQPEAEGQA